MRVYVPLVEDWNSNMRMLRITNVDDLIANLMNIFEPSLICSDGEKREDGIVFLYFLISFRVPDTRY